LTDLGKYFKVLAVVILTSVFIGSLSAFFLGTLNWATALRANQIQLVYFLPLAGIIIQYLYLNWGKESAAGSNLLIWSYAQTNKSVSWKMAPLIFIGTVLTHLFGGSAGREGTAVQMGGSMASVLARLFQLDETDKRLFLLVGISAGFASIFGTPWAGFIFAFEFLWAKNQVKESVLPTLLAAFVAHYTCLFFGATHTQFPPVALPIFSFPVLINVAIAGVFFGLAAQVFVRLNLISAKLFGSIQNNYLRIILGSFIVLSLVMLLEVPNLTGLGIYTIVASFNESQPAYYFLLKILLTVITLTAGFKGGEVTPLFFIGATLGSVLVWVLPLPISLLAALGLIAVFAGASNAPVSSIIMGAELFGFNIFFYLLLACTMAFMFSGFTGIYSAHPMGNIKRKYYQKILQFQRNFHKQ
jgi:H+/Cl- antiporter ClcA